MKRKKERYSFFKVIEVEMTQVWLALLKQMKNKCGESRCEEVFEEMKKIFDETTPKTSKFTYRKFEMKMQQMTVLCDSEKH